MEPESIDRESVESLTQVLMADFRRKGVDGHTAEDMIQEAWLRTLRNRGRPANLEAWLRVVGARLLVEFTRKGKTRRDHEHVAARREPWSAPPASLDSKVLRLVDELPEPYAEVVRLRYLDDVEVAGIARQLRRSEPTIRKQLKRGLQRLRARIEEGSTREQWSLVFLALWRRFGDLFGTRRRQAAALGSSLSAVVLIGFLVWPERERRGVDLARAEDARAPAGFPSIASASSGARSPLQPIASPAPATEADSLARQAAGTVRAPDGTPRAGSLVFRGSADGSRSELVATTDERGRFSVARCEVHDFLWATDPDFLTSPRVHVLMGLDGQPIDLGLEATAGRLALCLRDSRGSALAGLSVELEWDRTEIPAVLMYRDGSVQTPTSSISGTTDFAGRVVLPFPRRESTRLRVHGGGQASLSRVLELVPGEQTLDLTLDEPLALAGRVLDALGRPAAHARVEALQDDGRLSASATTDEAGRFSLEGLEPGACELRAVEDPERGTDSAVTNVRLGEDLPAVPPLELSPRWTLRGRATLAGEPLGGARVARFIGNGVDASTITDAEGGFAFPCSVQDAYLLALYAEGDTWPALCLEGARPGGEPVALSIDAAPALAKLVLEFTSDDPALIPTMVELNARRPLTAILRPVDRATNRCELQAPVGKEVGILVWIPGLGSMKFGVLQLEHDEVRRIAIPNPALVTFLVEFPDGVPAAPVRGRIERLGFGNPIFGQRYGTFPQYELTPDPDGRTFTARITPGTHNCSFLAEGLTHRPAWVEVLSGATQTEVVRLVRSVPVQVSVRLMVGEPTPALTLVLSDGERMGCHARAKRRDGDRAEFLVDLPPDAIALVATTRTRVGSTPVVIDSSRESPMSIEIELTEPSEPDKAVARGSKTGPR